MLGKIGRCIHLSQYVVRDTYITPVSILADLDPLAFAREFSLDADELNLLIHDKARAQRVAKTLIDEERSMEKEREKVDLPKKKRPAASVSCDKDVTGTAISQALIRSREAGEGGIESPPDILPLSPDRNDPPKESLRTGESHSDEEKQAGKRTQKTLFDGF